MQAADLPPDRRGPFLAGACDGDDAVRREVESLLAVLQADNTEASPPPAAPTHVGRYEILETIGEGGMGTVYKARQERPVRRTVALKLIKLGMDTKQVVARFDAERQALAMLEHPNIARVYDAGSSDTGRPYFVMELVDGAHITDYCDQQKLPIRQRLDLFIQVCQAVQHAHTRGIIHRDLKPSNVLVAVSDGVPVPKVIDFGIAKATQGRLTDQTVTTEQRQWLGTPQYMSPEQVDGGRDLDTRTDIYSLGVLLYELLTGMAPFDPRAMREAGAEEIARVIREARPPKLSTRLSAASVNPQETARLNETARLRGCDLPQLRHEIQGDLDWIVLKAIEKDRGRRYETASAFALDIQRHLDNEPVLARPPSTGYRVSRFVRRHRVGVTASAAVVVALVCGMIGTSLGLVRATTERTAAQKESRKSQAVSKFVTGILARARPGAGGDLRVVDFLKLASREVGTTLGDQPEAEIEVRQTLADTYWALGMFAEAEPEVNRAHALSGKLDQGKLSPRTLRLAAKLARIWYHVKPVDDPSTSRLARDTYAAAQRMLGDSDPITQISAQGLATVLALQGQPREAEQLVRRLLAQPSNQTLDRASDPEFLREMRISTLGWALHNQDTVDDEIIKLQRASIHRMKAETSPDPLALTDAETVLGTILADRGLEKEALEAFRLNFADCRELLGIVHSYTQWVTFVYAGALRRSGQWDAAIELLKENLRLFRTQQPEESRLLANAVVRLGAMQVDRHQVAGIATALDGLAMAQRVGGLPHFDTEGALRAALLGGLGSWGCPADGGLPAQVYCALDEMFRDNQPRLFDFKAAKPPSVIYHLRRWGDPASQVVEGTLDGLLASRRTEPGLYALTLDVAGSGTSRLHQRQWVLFAPWEVSIYLAKRHLIVPPDLRPGSSATQSLAWDDMDKREPSARQSADSLAFMAPLKTRPAPDGREEDFGLVARTAIDLPAGRYRFVVTSDDGARLYVDGKRIIDAWTEHRAKRDVADLQLSARCHDLKVEYFQAGGPYKLWVRIEPLEQ